MSDPRYRPVGYCAEPEGFGRAENVRWVADDGLNPVECAQLRASQLQHVFVCRIRERMRIRKISTGAKLARLVGSTADRWNKVLRGELIMRLEDVAAVELVLGELGTGLGVGHVQYDAVRPERR